MGAPQGVPIFYMADLKTALVLDWPSIDAAPGSYLSAWENTTTEELLELAGLKPDKVFVAASVKPHKWPDAFVGGKVGGALLPSYAADCTKVLDELEGYDIALTMGQHAMFCLTGHTAIDTYRGTHIDCPFVPGLQVVPTYAPFIYSRLNWAERPVVASAMQKALTRYADKDRTIYIPETTADLYWYATKHIRNEIVFDVETNYQGRITEFSAAATSTDCLYVQLETKSHEALWNEKDELDIWLWLHWLAQRKEISWGFHNAVYDLSYLDAYGIRPAGHIFDTMLRHHAFQPEWEKSLGFLASLHVPTRAWKHLRTQAKKDNNKAGAI